ncbi:MAG: threonine ammonia-lyase [Deltaproteobacteria bacterium]|nr:threonine ammonia-lyase [Deltaproteobacteria bacterium]
MISLSDVEAAARALEGHAVHTPLVCSEFFSQERGEHVYLKLENLQRTGSFKVRGATYKILRARYRIGPGGVVAASAGNHAQGVALAASALGVRATIIMPETAPLSKQLATRAYGGRVVLAGTCVADALEHAESVARAEGLVLVHPFDDDDVMAGQGTVGLEILADLPDVDEVWVPVGGGGLIAGIAAAVKGRRPETKVIGVQARACPSALRAREAGQPVAVGPCPTLADGIAVARVGARPFEVIQHCVDGLVDVDEDAIAAALVHLLERKKVLAEGAGAVTLAALLAEPAQRADGRRIALVVSGGNVDLNVLDRILERGLIRGGRILRFTVVLADVPGALASLLGVLAQERANILHIVHDRLASDVPLGSTRVEVWLETRGLSHGERITDALKSAGFAADGGVASS